MRNQSPKMFLNSLKRVEIQYTSSFDNIEKSCEKETVSNNRVTLSSVAQAVNRVIDAGVAQDRLGLFGGCMTTCGLRCVSQHVLDRA